MGIKRQGRIITICISDLINVFYKPDKHQANCQQKPVYDRNINLAHELPRSMNDFKTRETAKCC